MPKQYETNLWDNFIAFILPHHGGGDHDGVLDSAYQIRKPKIRH